MGLKAGWDKIRDRGQPVALQKLAYDTIVNKRRRYRLAIDMGIWNFHADFGQGGANPALRTIYYRLLRLLDYGIAPMLVLDGPLRPALKRGNYIYGGKHKLHDQVKELAEALGVEVREAPGEAEAEAALLAKEGVVDAVLTDDVDALMFGAPTILRNWSTTTSGALAEAVAGRRDTHVVSYTMSQVVEDVPELDADGLAFMALVSGGDYSEGLPGCGSETAIGLIRAQMHLPLLRALRTLEGDMLDNALGEWRDAVRQELITNASQKLKSRKPTLAANIPDGFPDLRVARAYLTPETSATTEHAHFQRPAATHTFDGHINVTKLVQMMTRRFDYTHALIMHKISRGLRRPILMRQFADLMACDDDRDVQSADFLLAVPRGSRYVRTSKDTDHIAEHRLELDLEKVWPYITLAESALSHPDPNVGKADIWRLKDNAEAELKGDFEMARTEEESRVWLATDLVRRSPKGRQLLQTWEEHLLSPQKKRSASPTKPVSQSALDSPSAPPPKAQTLVDIFSPRRKHIPSTGIEDLDGDLPHIAVLSPCSEHAAAARLALKAGHSSTHVIELSSDDEDASPVLVSPKASPKRKRDATSPPLPAPTAPESAAKVLLAAVSTSKPANFSQRRMQSTLAFPAVKKATTDTKGKGKARVLSPRSDTETAKSPEARLTTIDLD